MSEKVKVTMFLDKGIVDAIENWIKTEATHLDFFSALEFLLERRLARYGYVFTEIVEGEGWLDVLIQESKLDPNNLPTFVRVENKTGEQIAQENLFLLFNHDKFEQLQEDWHAAMRSARTKPLEDILRDLERD